MAKGIKIHGVLSDGTASEALIPYAVGDLDNGNAPYLDEHGQPLAVMQLRRVTNDFAKRLRKKHTSRVPDRTGKLEERFDSELFTADLIDYVIVSWEGLLGEDGDPLEQTRRAKLSLGADRLEHVLKAARVTEAADEIQAGFRQSA